MFRKVGVIGLGIMGSAMARNLRKAGFEVHVYNRSRARAAALEPDGITVEDSPAALTARVEAVILMLTGPQAVWQIVQGPAGVFARDGEGRLLIQSSTLNISTTKALAEAAAAANFAFLDAPVSGSRKQVEAAELIFEVGGGKELTEKARPLFSAMGREVVHAGAVGSGTALKLCMNLIVSQMTTGLCEAVALARALRIDPQDIFKVLAASPALNCLYYQIKKEPLLKREYPPAFSLANMLKDVRFMNEAAGEAALELPVTRAAQTLMEKAQARGTEDLTVMLEELLTPPV